MTATVAPALARPEAAKAEHLDQGLLRMAGVLIFGAILAILDATIVNVGIGAVARDLRSPLSTVQWVSTAYLLAVAMVMPLSGWAAERFGGKAMWMTSVALFVGGSALCGLAWSAPALIAFRVLQGLGGGTMQPIGQSILAQQAGPSRLARLMSVVSLPVMLAPVIGPVLVVVLQSALHSHGSASAAFGTAFCWALGLAALTLIPAVLFPGRVTR